jgi:hypothetical protein
MPYFITVYVYINIILIFIERIKFSAKNACIIKPKIKLKLNLN